MINESEVAPDGLKKEIVKGFAWSILARWGVRALGLVSTVVLARMLEPEDFGLIAIAMVFTAIMGSLLSLDFDNALIRLSSLEARHFDTAWTLSLVVGVIFSGLLFLSAPFIADYYRESKLEFIIQWLSINPLIAGLRNPKIAIFRRELKFKKDFIYITSVKLASVLITVILAIAMRDYRALIYGLTAGQVVATVTTYLMIPHMPRFTLAAKDEILSFSLWLSLRNVGIAAMMRIEQFLIGSNFGTQNTSYYYLGNELGTMLTAEFALPIGRALLPGFSLAKDRPDRLLKGMQLSFGAVTIVLPLGFGIAALAPEFISVVFGEKWLPVAPLLELLSIAGAMGMLAAPFGPLLLTRGQSKEVALIMITASLTMLLFAWSLLAYESLELIAGARIGVQVGIFIAFMLCALKPWKGEARKFLVVASRPLISSLVMFCLIKFAKVSLIVHPMIAIFIWAFIGVLVFLTTLFVLWLMMRKPQGLETLLLDVFKREYQITKRRFKRLPS